MVLFAAATLLPLAAVGATWLTRLATLGRTHVPSQLEGAVAGWGQPVTGWGVAGELESLFYWQLLD